MYIGDRWNFGGPGSVARASYVWLPLLLVPTPSGNSSSQVTPAAAESPQAPGPQGPCLKSSHSCGLAGSVEHETGEAGGPSSGIVAAEPGHANDLTPAPPELSNCSRGWWCRMLADWKAAGHVLGRHLAGKPGCRGSLACWLRLGLRMQALKVFDIMPGRLLDAARCCRNNEPTETFTLVFRSSWRLRDFLGAPALCLDMCEA